MNSIAFAVVDHDYINPLRVTLKTFRNKNTMSFKVFKIDEFEVPDDLKEIPNVEYLDFIPKETIKFVTENYMFAHLEIEDLLMKEYDVVFKTDLDVCYFENIDTIITDFYKSNKPIGMSREQIQDTNNNRPLYSFYKERNKAFNCGFIMLNSKLCLDIFKTVKNSMIKVGFDKCIFLDQDALNYSFDDVYDLTYSGFINANMPSSEALTEKFIALHYNVTEKPFADISVKHWFDAIAITTYAGYLKVAEMCNCSKEFLEKIKKHIEFVKGNIPLKQLYWQRSKLVIGKVINKKMNELEL